MSSTTQPFAAEELLRVEAGRAAAREALAHASNRSAVPGFLLGVLPAVVVPMIAVSLGASTSTLAMLAGLALGAAVVALREAYLAQRQVRALATLLSLDGTR
jgi:hypothetical protein